MLKLLILSVTIAVCLALSNETTEPWSTSTTLQPTTSIPYDPSKPTLMNFTIPKNDYNQTCLKLNFALMMNFNYRASYAGKEFNATLSTSLPVSLDDYDGICKDKLNTIQLKFWNNWTLDFEYTLQDSKYKLSSLMLTYNIQTAWFPNATADSFGIHTVNASGLNEFSTSKDSSFKCDAKTTISLGSDITFDFTHYHAEPFFSKFINNKGEFDTAVECEADIAGTSKLVPIIVGSALAFLIVLVLIAYIIGRRRHRSGYQTV